MSKHIKNVLDLHIIKDLRKIVEDYLYDLQDGSTKDQHLCILNTLDALKDERVVMINGAAGVGKTFTVSKILTRYHTHDRQYAFIAPTHKALNVLMQKTTSPIDAYNTVHKFLEYEKTYTKSGKLIFVSKAGPKSKNNLFTNSKNSIVICDEVSMLTNKMYNDLLTYCKIHKKKLLLIGDFNQLPPVNDIGEPWHLKVRTITLEGTVRASTPELKKLYNFFRKNVQRHAMPNEIITKMKTKYKAHIIRSQKQFDYLINGNQKVIAYSNKKVDYYNDLIINKLFPNKRQDYCVGQMIQIGEYYYHSNGLKIEKGMEFQIMEVKEKLIINEYFDSSFLCYELFLQNGIKINKLWKSQQKKFEEIKNKKRSTIRPNQKSWEKFYSEVSSIDPVLTNPYAITCYGAQGSTYEVVYVDLMNVINCLAHHEKYELINKALYTATTRASKEVYFLVY